MSGQLERAALVCRAAVAAAPSLLTGLDRIEEHPPPISPGDQGCAGGSPSRSPVPSPPAAPRGAAALPPALMHCTTPALHPSTDCLPAPEGGQAACLGPGRLEERLQAQAQPGGGHRLEQAQLEACSHVGFHPRGLDL